MPDRPRPPLLLVLALLALPQVAETILSPALPALASHWRLDDATSQWTMALFFVGFAPGIWLWGWLADRLGRRPALLGGLGLAALATFGAWASTDYSYLLACRLVQGLGLATCSVTVQASLRDVLQGTALMSYFVTLGAVLAWSPAVGPLGGQWLADLGGHPAVFATLAVLLASLAALVVPAWPETRPLLAGTPEPATLAIFRRVLADRPLQTRALLVAVLNVLVFSFYAAGPFMVGDLPGLGFGWIGLAIALAGSLGALLNRRLPHTWNSARRVRLGLALAA
ncbi:MFS transporter, partial [Pseudomonas aeruginosa]|nr:MFS transporter [Pseudomonas aeruginosa]